MPQVLDLHDGSSPAPRIIRSAGRFLSTMTIAIFGVILPLATILVEFVTEMCGREFFSPLPTYWHALLALTVPAANALALMVITAPAHEPQPTRAAAAALLIGVAIAAGAYFSLMFAILLPLAVIAIIFLGLGLLPLSPLTGLLCALLSARRLGQILPPPRRMMLISSGIVIGLVAVLAVQWPMTRSVRGLVLAASSTPHERAQGLRMLRSGAGERELVRLCYGQGNRFDPVTRATAGWLNLSPEQARQIYYRATGRSFNSAQRPAVGSVVTSRWDDWDDAQGGERVAGRVRDLALKESRIDGVIESAAATAYLEWTMVLRNDSSRQQEARTQLALPLGGVVSRATLWVNGEPREAAFGGKAQVREAYERVVRVERRDPLLVTHAGPDRILVQCFPVPPNGEMKIRIGITAPLALTGPAAAQLLLPAMNETNFDIDPNLLHAVWLEHDMPITLAGLTRQSSQRGYVARGAIVHREFNRRLLATVQRDPAQRISWTGEPVNDQAAIIVQEIEQRRAEPIEAIVLLVDRHAAMKPLVPQIADALIALPRETELAVLTYGDEITMLTSGFERISESGLAPLQQKLRRVWCAGGSDATAALQQAWDLLASRSSTGSTMIVWLHGPQAELLDRAEPLRQRLELGRGGPRVVSVQLSPGPHRVLEALDGLVETRAVPDVKQLSAMLTEFTSRTQTVIVCRQVADPPADAAHRASSHLSRLWAAGRVRELLGRSRDRNVPEAIAFAAAYQLVTPVTGAVVLETQQQYDEAKLVPADATKVPTIPEPSSAALLLGTVALLLLRRRRRVTG